MRKPRFARTRRGERGFVLVATLWIIAALTLGAAYFSEQVDRARRLAQQAQDASTDLVDMESTRAEVLFRLATTDLSIHGLGPDAATAVALDDRPYRGTGGDVVQLQDQRGLLNLNFPDREVLMRLLAQFGVPLERRDALVDALQDYIDLDDFRRLNGAEKAQYEAQHLPPPPNDWLTSPFQLRAVLGWREEEGLWQTPRFLATVGTAPVGVFNPNTAPREVLASLAGSSPEIADTVIRARRQAPMTSWALLESLTGYRPRDLETVAWTPGDSLRVTQRARNLPWMLQFSVFLTPTSTEGPWRVDYHARAGVDEPTDDKDIPPLPARVAQPAAQAAPF